MKRLIVGTLFAVFSLSAPAFAEDADGSKTPKKENKGGREHKKVKLEPIKAKDYVPPAETPPAK